MTESRTAEIVSSSFRDPSGFVFRRGGSLYRQVNTGYRDNYDHLMSSGLYNHLAAAGLLIPHEETDVAPLRPELSYKVIRPEFVRFVSYPYEWSFSQLKDAALAVLRIQKTCLDFSMSLKDSSAYNIQFVRGRPVLIDTLSFEAYRDGSPWVAYRQFCQHFLAPLALMAYNDIRLNQLLRVYIDGVPLDLASSLLPMRTRLGFSLLSHIHLHAKSQKRYGGQALDSNRFRMSRMSLLGIIDSLEAAIRKLRWNPHGTEWVDYYSDTNYSSEAFEDKKRIVTTFLQRIKPARVWDLGANLGTFSRLACGQGAFTVSMDIDPAAVERNYLTCREAREENILPLLVDLANPSPGIGWENEERLSLSERGPADTVLALALVHHLAISNNLPLDRIALFLRSISDNLIIEFVPKSDSQVQRLLSTREDIFSDYTRAAFEREFEKLFSVVETTGITDSDRVIYLMKKK